MSGVKGFGAGSLNLIWSQKENFISVAHLVAQLIASMSTLARVWCVNQALHDVQNFCALTITVGTVLET